jgi:hypothetical protein
MITFNAMTPLNCTALWISTTFFADAAVGFSSINLSLRAYVVLASRLASRVPRFSRHPID